MRIRKAVYWAALLLCVWQSTAHAQLNTILPTIYKIKISDCSSGQLQPGFTRVQTGFVLEGEKGIVTALHGVLGCSSIRALQTAGPHFFKKLKIVKVDLKRDIALLDSSEVAADIPSLRKGSEYSSKGLLKTEYQDLELIGFHDEIGFPYPKRLTRVFLYGAISELNTTTVERIRARRSPGVDVRMIMLDGVARPGHSGAPLWDPRTGAAIGVVLGGIKGGLANLGFGAAVWDIDLEHVSCPSSGHSSLCERLSDLEKSATEELFAFTVEPRISTISKTVDMVVGSQYAVHGASRMALAIEGRTTHVLSANESTFRVNSLLDDGSWTRTFAKYDDGLHHWPSKSMPLSTVALAVRTQRAAVLRNCESLTILRRKQSAGGVPDWFEQDVVRLSGFVPTSACEVTLSVDGRFAYVVGVSKDRIGKVVVANIAAATDGRSRLAQTVELPEDAEMVESAMMSVSTFDTSTGDGGLMLSRQGGSRIDLFSRSMSDGKLRGYRRLEVNATIASCNAFGRPATLSCLLRMDRVFRLAKWRPVGGGMFSTEGGSELIELDAVDEIRQFMLFQLDPDGRIVVLGSTKSRNAFFGDERSEALRDSGGIHFLRRRESFEGTLTSHPVSNCCSLDEAAVRHARICVVTESQGVWRLRCFGFGRSPEIVFLRKAEKIRVKDLEIEMDQDERTIFLASASTKAESIVPDSRESYCSIARGVCLRVKSRWDSGVQLEISTLLPSESED